MPINNFSRNNLNATPNIIDTNDDMQKLAEANSAEADRLEEAADAAEAQEDAEEENEDRRYNARNNIHFVRRREARKQRAEARARRKAAREQRAAERLENNNARRELEQQKAMQREQQRRADAALNANNVKQSLDAIKEENRKKVEQKAREAAEEERKRKERLAFNVGVVNSLPAEKNVATKVGFNASRQEKLRETNEIIKNTTVEQARQQAVATTLFRPPIITKNRHEFRNLENSNKLKSRVEIDSEIDLNRLLRDAALTPRRPEIVAKIPLFQILSNKKGVVELHELRQFEKQMQLEDLDELWGNIDVNLNENLRNEITRINTFYTDGETKNLQFLSDLRESMDISINLLDIRRNSRQLTQSAKNYSQNLLIPREQDFSSYPEDIESFFSDKCRFTTLSPKYFSNTKLVHTLIREFANAIKYFHPSTLSAISSPRDDKFSFRYIAYSTSKNIDVNQQEMSVASVGTRNLPVVKNTNTTFGIGRRPVTEGVYDALPGIKEDYLRIPAERIKVLSTLLHNELVVSSGISRLFSTPLGNKYSISSVDPIERILGGYFKNSSTVLTGGGSAMSFADMLVLNEFNGESSLILPFENTIVKNSNGKSYVPGSSYFIEAPIQQGQIKTPLSQFSDAMTSFDTDSQTILKTLLCFDEECKFTPDNIVIRCIRAIRDIVAILSTNSDTNRVPPTLSLPVALLTAIHQKNFKSPPSNIFSSSYTKKPVDMLFTLCARYRANLDKQLAQQEFVPNKSYARLVDGTTHPFESDDSVDNLNFFDALIDSGINLAIQKNIDWADSLFLAPNPNRIFQSVNLADPDSVENNILGVITKVLRSIQTDVYELSIKNTTASSYLDEDRLTRYNRWDDNTMLACIFEIFRCLFQQLFPLDDVIIKNENDDNLFSIKWDELNTLRLRDFLDILLNAYDSDQPLESIFDENGNADSIFGINQSTTFKTAGMTAGQAVEMINSLIDHRKFLKLCLGYTTSIAKNVSDANAKTVRFFENNLSELGSFSDRFATLYLNRGGKLAIEMLTPEQNSLKQAYSLSKQPLARGSRLKKCSINTQVEDDIQEFFLNEMSIVTNDGVALCVGLPSGLIKNQKHPAKIEGAPTDISDTIYTNNDIRKKNAKITFNKVSELYPDVSFSPVSALFDTELFILPGDMAFSTNDLTGEIIRDMNSIIRGTTYTRIVNGKIIDIKTGQEILQNEDNPEVTLDILYNHIIDRIYKNFARDVMGVSLDEHTWFVDSNFNSVIIDADTYSNLEKMLANTNISSLTQLSTGKLKLLFENVNVPGLEGMKKLCSTTRLRQILGFDISFNTLEQLIKMLGNFSLNSFVESQRTLCPRHFDRIFVTLFSNTRNSNVFLKTFDINEVDVSLNDMERLKQAMSQFEISGYMCNVEVI
jgi:hypothetical protein